MEGIFISFRILTVSHKNSFRQTITGLSEKLQATERKDCIGNSQIMEQGGGVKR